MARLSDEALEKVFSRLKPYCVDLLDLLRNPKKSPSFLRDMADFLRQAPPEALQPSVDYTMFPLLLLLDASVRCRAGDKGGDLGGAAGLEIADSAAEGVLMCLEELLKKCHLGSVNQMVVVLKKLTSGALLSPTEAAEEFREGVIRCLRAMLFRIKPCSIRSCTCRKISFPTIIGSLEVQYSISLKYYHEPEECLLAFFQSQNASAAVGHWLSLLLQIAESEVVRGHRGSSNLRKEALLTLRVLVAKIGTADALAFFLPGIVSRFAKALHVSKGIISGAAGNTGSIEHAVRGLAEFLMIVLSDEVNLHGLEMSMDGSTVLPPNKSESTVSVLEALRQLPVNTGYRSENSEHSTQQAIAVISCNKVVDEKNDGYPVGNRTLYVHRTKEWIDRTSEQVDKLLRATFPHLSTHPAEKVRKGLVDGIRGLLTNCCYTLKRSKLMLLECLCILICDDSVAVSVAAQESLESLFVLGEKFLKENEISELFTSHIEKLPRMVLGSEEAVAVSHARRLLALMYYAGPELVVYHLLSSPFKAGRFLEFLGLSFSHNSQFAGSFEKLISSKPLSIGYLLSVAELKSGTLGGDASHPVGNATPPVVFEISDFRERGLQHSVGNIDSGYELPHMPPWFSNIGSEKLYVALAGILRLSGLSLVTGHKTDLSLSSLVDILLDYFRKLISELRMKDYYKEGWQTWYTRSGSGRLLRETSSAVCMLNEIIYGLSDQSVNLYSRLFSKTWEEVEGRGEHIVCDSSGFIHNKAAWKVGEGKDARDNIIHCIGSILHEYMSPEVWELPVDQKSPLLDHATEAELSLHFLRDATILHQAIYLKIHDNTPLLLKE
ncbi:uncharacterized protein M6B38_283970 [Iris pallida]|uniref:TTI1 N-terminal TPR domain-containing protein n=1 Tax=Iris pallida TaxID=29817 RepID=A0AAX6I2A6_IRIPA|nr:uncharacterized protein M6B38_283970 [Iris pallida]